MSVFNNVLLRVKRIRIRFHVCTFLLRSNAFYKLSEYETTGGGEGGGGANNGTIIYRDAFIVSSLTDCSDVGNILV